MLEGRYIGPSLFQPIPTAGFLSRITVHSRVLGTAQTDGSVATSFVVIARRVPCQLVQKRTVATTPSSGEVLLGDAIMVCACRRLPDGSLFIKEHDIIEDQDGSMFRVLASITPGNFNAQILVDLKSGVTEDDLTHQV